MAVLTVITPFGVSGTAPGSFPASKTVLLRSLPRRASRCTGSSSTVYSRKVLPRGQPNSSSSASDGSRIGCIDTIFTYTCPSASYWSENTS